jgi:acyl-CoA thioesterase
VDRVRDGGATSARRVIASQDGVEVFTALVSFQRNRDGLRHQAEYPPATAPEDLLPLHERFADSDVPIPDWWRRPRAIELRHVDDPRTRRRSNPARIPATWCGCGPRRSCRTILPPVARPPPPKEALRAADSFLTPACWPTPPT